MEKTINTTSEKLSLFEWTIYHGLYKMNIVPKIKKEDDKTYFILNNQSDFITAWDYIRLTLMREIPGINWYFKWNNTMVINYKNETVIIQYKPDNILIQISESISKLFKNLKSK